MTESAIGKKNLSVEAYEHMKRLPDNLAAVERLFVKR